MDGAEKEIKPFHRYTHNTKAFLFGIFKESQILLRILNSERLANIKYFL